jgi:gamma-glutamylcyclotransferase (GGCT)/AIG2-like uncharacterized protein YtfP
MRLSLLYETNLFFYGTLKDHGKLKNVVGNDTLHNKKDTLDDYKKVHEGDYPNIVKKKGSKVDGVVHSVTPTQVRKVDDWEEKYKRINVKLRSGKGAHAYHLTKHDT